MLKATLRALILQTALAKLRKCLRPFSQEHVKAQRFSSVINVAQTSSYQLARTNIRVNSISPGLIEVSLGHASPTPFLNFESAHFLDWYDYCDIRVCRVKRYCWKNWTIEPHWSIRRCRRGRTPRFRLTTDAKDWSSTRRSLQQPSSSLQVRLFSRACFVISMSYSWNNSKRRIELREWGMVFSDLFWSLSDR